MKMKKIKCKFCNSKNVTEQVVGQEIKMFDNTTRYFVCNDCKKFFRIKIKDKLKKFTNEEVAEFNNKLIDVFSKFVPRKYLEFDKNFDKEKEIKLARAIENIRNRNDVIDTNNVTRVEVIDEKGRSYVNWKDNNVVTIQLQDDNKTLKIFIEQFKIIKR